MMKSNLKIILFVNVLLTIIVLAGCTDHRDLYVSSTPVTRIESDWKTEARLSPDIWTVLFYDESGKLVNKMVTDKLVDMFYLSEGRYKSLMFNGTLGSGIDYVRFRGTDNYETAEAYATDNSLPKMLKYSQNNRVVNNPDTLAAIDKNKNILGDKEYLRKYQNGNNQGTSYGKYVGDSINYILKRLTHKINVIVKIKGLQNLLASSSVLGYLDGFAGSVFFASRLPSHDPVSHEIIFKNNNPVGATEGKIYAAFNTFGPPLDLNNGERIYTLNLFFKLRDGSIYEYVNTEDVTRDVERIIGKIKMGNTIDMVLEVMLEITLPDVKDAGIDVGVDDWGDGETIVIPI